MDIVKTKRAAPSQRIIFLGRGNKLKAQYHLQYQNKQYGN